MYNSARGLFGRAKTFSRHLPRLYTCTFCLEALNLVFKPSFGTSDCVLPGT